MTLVELVVAFAILMVLLVPIALLLTNVLGQAATARNKLTALSLAEQCLEKLNNTGPTLSQGVPETGVAILENSHCFGTSAVVESTVTYDIHAEFSWQPAQGSHPDLCTSPVAPTVIEAKVWTTWAHTQKVSDTTLLDYPPPGLPTDGFLAVSVNGTPSGSPPADASGKTWSTRVQSVPVTISRTGYSETLHPDSYGCVFAQVAAPDTYTVSAQDPTVGGQPATPAWMSASETTTTSQTVAANLGTVSHVTLRYDEGVLVSLHYPTTTAAEGPVSCPGVNELECVIFGQKPSSSATPADAPAAEISVLDTTSKTWSIASPAGVARLDALTCAGTARCIAVGYGTSTGSPHGVSLSTGTSSNPSFVPSGVPGGVSGLNGVTCPTSARCYAWGTGSSGAVILTGTVTATGVAWGAAVDTLATVPARVTSLSCWSTTRCYALGTKKTSTSPIVLSLSTTTARKWAADTLPSTTTYTPLTLTQLTCPAATTCYAVGTRKTSHADAVSLSATTARKWTNDTLPSTLTVLSQVTCPAKATCYAIGSRGTGSAYGAISSLTTATSWRLDTPATTARITAITCPSSSACLALGTSSTGSPALLWRTGPGAFTSEALPASVNGISTITCVDATHCFATGVASSAGSSYGVLLSGTATWRLDSLPSATGVTAFFGIACGATACAAPGATEAGPVYLDGAPNTTAWTAATPSGTQGLYTGGVPIAITSSGLTTNPEEVAVPSGTAAAGQIGPLFPFSAGYGVAATDCKPLPASVHVTATPGATSAATMPMGLLSIRAQNRFGNPDTGATVTAAPATGAGCTLLAPPAGKSNPASYALESTGPEGISQVALPYGTYMVSVTHAGHTTTLTNVSLTPTSVSATTAGSAPLGTILAVTVT